MRLGFYMANTQPGDMDFGCLTQMFADGIGQQRVFPTELEGRSFTGSYRDCIAFADGLKTRARAVVIFTDGGGDENEFVKAIAGMVACPVVGGGAARSGGRCGEGFCGVQNGGSNAQAAVLVLTDENVHVQACTCNIHQQILEECNLELTDKRTIRRINGVDARTFLWEKKRQHGFAKDDYERVTLSTLDHINAHLSEQDGVIRSGRDLDERMLLRAVIPGQEQEMMENFYQEKPNAVVFGCAGLGGLLSHPFACDGLGAFLFGEICSHDGTADFGNLMLSRLEISKK